MDPTILHAVLAEAEASNAHKPLAEITSCNKPASPTVPKIKLPDVGSAVKPVAALPLRAPASALPSAEKQGAATEDDKLTPRLLDALANLDVEAGKLAALSPRAKDVSPAETDDEDEPAWLTEAAATATAKAASSSSDEERTKQALRASKELPVAVSVLSRELRTCEDQCRHMRSAALTQATVTAEVTQQLELTKSAAESTASAARRIVDDHEKDVGLLLHELRRVSPEAAAAIEGRLSAPLAALNARRRHAQAASAHRKKAASRTGSPARGVPRSSSFGHGPTTPRPGPVHARPASRPASPMLERFSSSITSSISSTAQLERNLSSISSSITSGFTSLAADVTREVARVRAGSPFRGRPASDD